MHRPRLKYGMDWNWVGGGCRRICCRSWWRPLTPVLTLVLNLKHKLKIVKDSAGLSRWSGTWRVQGKTETAGSCAHTDSAGRPWQWTGGRVNGPIGPRQTLVSLLLGALLGLAPAASCPGGIAPLLTANREGWMNKAGSPEQRFEGEANFQLLFRKYYLRPTFWKIVQETYRAIQAVASGMSLLRLGAQKASLKYVWKFEDY